MISPMIRSPVSRPSPVELLSELGLRNFEKVPHISPERSATSGRVRQRHAMRCGGSRKVVR